MGNDELYLVWVQPRPFDEYHANYCNWFIAAGTHQTALGSATLAEVWAL